MVIVHSYVSLPEGRDGFMMCHGQYIYMRIYGSLPSWHHGIRTSFGKSRLPIPGSAGWSCGHRRWKGHLSSGEVRWMLMDQRGFSMGLSMDVWWIFGNINGCSIGLSMDFWWILGHMNININVHRILLRYNQIIPNYDMCSVCLNMGDTSNGHFEWLCDDKSSKFGLVPGTVFSNKPIFVLWHFKGMNSNQPMVAVFMEISGYLPRGPPKNSLGFTNPVIDGG